MKLAEPRHGALMVTYAVCLHFVWGIALIVSRHRIVPTPLGDLQRLMSQSALATAMLTVAALAIWGVFSHDAFLALVLCLPQQMLLVLSAESSGRAIIAGHYADGVPRPHAFILVDQFPAILAATLHTWAIYSLHHSRA